MWIAAALSPQQNDVVNELRRLGRTAVIELDVTNETWESFTINRENWRDGTIRDGVSYYQLGYEDLVLEAFEAGPLQQALLKAPFDLILLSCIHADHSFRVAVDVSDFVVDDDSAAVQQLAETVSTERVDVLSIAKHIRENLGNRPYQTTPVKKRTRRDVQVSLPPDVRALFPNDVKKATFVQEAVEEINYTVPRDALSANTNTASVRFYLPDRVRDKVDAAAGQLGVSRSEWVAAALRLAADTKARNIGGGLSLKDGFG